MHNFSLFRGPKFQKHMWSVRPVWKYSMIQYDLYPQSQTFWFMLSINLSFFKHFCTHVTELNLYGSCAKLLIKCHTAKIPHLPLHAKVLYCASPVKEKLTTFWFIHHQGPFVIDTVFTSTSTNRPAEVLWRFNLTWHPALRQREWQRGFRYQLL